MTEITLRKIVDDVNALYDVPYKHILLSSSIATETGNGAISTALIGAVPYKSWRVRDVGFVVITAGASTVAEQVSIGFAEADAPPSGSYRHALGVLTQDITINKNLSIGDCFQRYNFDFLAAPTTPELSGTHVWTAGEPDYCERWQNKHGLININKENVAGSTATVLGWALIEIGEV